MRPEFDALRAKYKLTPLEPRAFDMVEVYHPQHLTVSCVHVIGHGTDNTPVAVGYSKMFNDYVVYRLTWHERFAKWWATRIE